MSTQIDARTGLGGDVAIKVPCVATTTANITLSALQTIDSITLVADDRVLVRDQTDQTENGIYLASSGSWTRTADFNGVRDVVDGTLVRVQSGTLWADTLWAVTTIGDISFGTTNITFSSAPVHVSVSVTLDMSVQTAPSTTDILVAGDTESYWLPFSTAAQSFALPAVAGLTAGARVGFINPNQAYITVTTASGEKIILGPNNELTETFFIQGSGLYHRGDQVVFMYTGVSGNEWRVINGSPQYMRMPGHVADGKCRWLVDLATNTEANLRAFDGNSLDLYHPTSKQWLPHTLSNSPTVANGQKLNALDCTIDGTTGQDLSGLLTAHADTTYNAWVGYVYMVSDEAGGMTIDLSKTAPAQEAVSGVMVKGTGGSQDPARRLVGQIAYLDNNIKFGASEANYNSGSYYNRLMVNVGNSTGLGGNHNNGTWTAIDAANTRTTVIAWGDGTEHTAFLNAEISQDTATAAVFIGIGVDGADPAAIAQRTWIAPSNGAAIPVCFPVPLYAQSAGLHTYQIMLKTSGSGVASVANGAFIAVKIND